MDGESEMTELKQWINYPDAISPEFAAGALRNMRKSVEMQSAKIQSNGGETNSKVRRSRVGWINPNQFQICKIIREHVFRANRECQWNIWLSDKVEWQLTHYTAEDKGFYKPHMDTLSTLGETDRKISVVVPLSVGNSYEGGDFQLPHIGGQDQRCMRKVGSITIFPSYCVHGVQPVTKGERWSLVSWHHGPRWR